MIEKKPEKFDDKDNLNTIETTLRDVLSFLATDRTGDLARAHGWPAPDEEQGTAMTRLVLRVLTETVRGMRHPDALPPSREELDQVLDGIALGVIEKVMGPRPTPELVH